MSKQEQTREQILANFNAKAEQQAKDPAHIADKEAHEAALRAEMRARHEAEEANLPQDLDTYRRWKKPIEHENANNLSKEQQKEAGHTKQAPGKSDPNAEKAANDNAPLTGVTKEAVGHVR